MKWIFFITLLCNVAFAKPPQKAPHSAVNISESFSLATLGIEAEAYRIQHLVLNGKSTYMLAKLINGNLTSEKPIPVGTYQKMKASVQSLLKMESNEDCKTPIRFTFRSPGHGDDQLKLCFENMKVSGPMKHFNEKAKKMLGIESPSQSEGEHDTSPDLEKSKESLPEEEKVD